MLQSPSSKLYQPKILQLHIINNAVYVNNVKVISEYSRMRLKIFYILLDQFLQDFKNGLPPEKYKFFDINQLAELLGIDSTTQSLEQKIRRPLNKMQQTIRENLLKELGIKCNDVIESIGWPGYTAKDYGYRLNPFILSLSVAKPECTPCLSV